MTGMLVSYARVSTNDQDLTAQKNAFAALGVSLQMTFTDQGLTGTNRARPGRREALAACRAGHTLVVTKLDRLGGVVRHDKLGAAVPTVTPDTSQHRHGGGNLRTHTAPLEDIPRRSTHKGSGGAGRRRGWPTPNPSGSNRRLRTCWGDVG